MKPKHITATILTVVMLLWGVGSLWAEPPAGDEATTKQEKAPKSICPVTKMGEDCLYCHTQPSFKLKETDPVTEGLIFPYNLSLTDDGTKAKHFYYVLDDITPHHILEAFRYMDRHPELPRKIVIEVHSPGGSAFDGWRIVNIIRSYWPKYEIETRLNGMAFSAGFMIFEAGERRCASPTAELMWHEVAYYEFLAKVTPEKSQNQFKMMRHLQDNANTWLASRTNGKMTKKQIDEKAAVDVGWWFNGKEALEYGFADDCSAEDKEPGEGI